MSMVLVKCPKCRFPNAPDLTVCRRCRHRFVRQSRTRPAEDVRLPLAEPATPSVRQVPQKASFWQRVSRR